MRYPQISILWSFVVLAVVHTCGILSCLVKRSLKSIALRRQLDAERFIVKASSGPRYVVTCKVKLDKSKLVSGSRVSLDMTTLTIMRLLPREVGYSGVRREDSRIECPISAVGRGQTGPWLQQDPKEHPLISLAIPCFGFRAQLILAAGQVDPMVFSMLHEDPGKISYSDVGGLTEQIRQMREVIELPLTNPESQQHWGSLWRFLRRSD